MRVARIDSRRVLLFGASGTIGRAVAQAALDAGHAVTAIVRDSASGREAGDALAAAGATIVVTDVADAPALHAAIKGERFEVAISCLASRTGTPEDAEAIDKRANVKALNMAKAAGISQFIYLSAICVQKPKLAFQHAKLGFEAELQQSGVTWSIVRPTAFFKSLSGQIDRVRRGKSYLLFGDGELTRCKPISDADLAAFIIGCIDDPQRQNAIMPIGGPGPAISPLEQGRALFEMAGRKPKYRRVPIGMLDVIIGLLSFGGRISARLAAKAEYARIGRYYATESMLVWDEKAGAYDADGTPETGSDTLFDHYARELAARG